MRTSPRLLSLGVLLILGLPARSAPPVDGGEKPVSVEFSLYAWQGDVVSLRYAPSRTVEALEAFERSLVHVHQGPAFLAFFPADGQKPPAGGTPPPPVASITFPPGATKVTLITVTAGRGRYFMYAVPEDGGDFTGRSIRVHNLTATPLIVSYDDTARVELAPSSAATLRPAGQATLIRVARFENGKWRNLFNNVAELGTDGRQNVILAATGNTAVRMITLPPWPRTLTPAKPSGRPAP